MGHRCIAHLNSCLYCYICQDIYPVEYVDALVDVLVAATELIESGAESAADITTPRISNAWHRLKRALKDERLVDPE